MTFHTCYLEFKDNLYEAVQVKSFCTLSEDIRHDPPAVFAHLKLILDFLKNAKPQLNVLHLLSDSPSTQHRNKSIFY